MEQSQLLFEVQNGQFSYGSQIILENLHFTLQPKTFYGLIGPNGSGKSTLIDVFMGTGRLQRGSILLHSIPMREYSRKELARKLALVPQNISVGFDFSVFDIVLMGRHPHIPRFSPPTENDLDIVQRALELLDIVHLKNRTVTHLSGGEKQRVIVARALAQDTEVLILDEATSNLDIEHSLEIMRILRNRVETKGVTVIAAIHDLNLAAAFCDKLIVLNDRTICNIGEVTSVLTATLIRQVFSVTAKITMSTPHNYPRIEYNMYDND